MEPIVKMVPERIKLRPSHILRSVYMSDALANWAPRLACWPGGIIFVFIGEVADLIFVHAHILSFSII